MSGLDPHDARAVLRGLTRRLDRALSERDPQWRCLRILPRPDGAATLVLGRGSTEETLLWVPDEARSAPGGAEAPWGALVGAGAQVEPSVRAVVARVLARSMADPAFALLAFVNRDLQVLRFGDAVVDTLLAGRLAPGHTRWFGWLFTEVFQGAADRFVLCFDGPSGRMTLAVTAPQVVLEDAAQVAQAAQYRLWLVADPRPPGDRERVSEQVERFLAFLLARAVHPGLTLEGEQVVDFDGGALGSAALADPYGQGAPVSTARWGNPRQWHQFFSDFEVARAGLCSLVFTEPQAFVTYGEPECHRVEPTVRPRHHVFARIPFAQRSVRPEPGSREFAVVMRERDLVFGATEPLSRALDAAEEHPGARFVVLNNTCLPKMSGDDVASLVSSRRAAGGKPVLAINTDLESPEATYRDLVRQTVGPGAAGSQAGVRGGIGLLGFTPGKARDELVALGRALGLPVTGCLGPEMSPRRAADFRQAALQVVYPAPPWPSLSREILDGSSAQAVTPWAPFGLVASRDWFVAVAGALGGAAPDFLERYEAEVAPLSSRFDELRGEVEGVGVALVVDAQETDRLFDPARCYGVRLLPLLGECGFALHLLLRLEPDRAGEALPEAVVAQLEEARFPGSVLHLHPFTAMEELHFLLHDESLRLAYSEVACDERLARHGLVSFGLDLLELGPAGAVRSMQRLHRLARWPFFSRYVRRGRP